MRQQFGVSKTGRFVEFPDKGKPYWKFLALKSFALVIDYLLMFIPQILVNMFTNFQLWALSLASFIWAWSYFSLMFIGFKRTIGMALVRIHIIHSSGFVLKYYHLALRSCVEAIYVVPIFGWALMICNVLTVPFVRLTLVDYLSSTQTVTVRALDHLKKIEQESFI